MSYEPLRIATKRLELEIMRQAMDQASESGYEKGTLPYRYAVSGSILAHVDDLQRAGAKMEAQGMPESAKISWGIARVAIRAERRFMFGGGDR